ncbi:MAG: iron-sulfur cluster assembly scaffold protein [Patescibacteria group bacterium]|jgi:nitrogen fixation NifU-like protein|nr:iron-sulfur cluster assembly scaffold protein [Patescibacteria group bacterium]
MALNYTKKTMDNFLKPKNIGQMKKADGYAQIGNMVCGDQLDFFLKVENGKIKDVKFLSFGCASNIATASVMTEKVKGMTIEEAKKYPWQKVSAELGGLPSQKQHCSVMAVQGLQKAIADYEERQKDIKETPKKKTKTTKAKRVKTKTTKAKPKATKKAKTTKKLR